ncbi:MAG: hypothetical protein ACFE88_13890 [Candidatus Hermodarchaeota archaeon]
MQEEFRWFDFKITNRCNNNCVYYRVEHDIPTVIENLYCSIIESALQDAILKDNYIYRIQNVTIDKN